MPEELPKYLDTRRLADHIGTLAGVVAPGRLRRLGSPFAAARPVVVRLDLRTEDVKGLRLVGEISTELKATCQRCLNEMDIGIEKTVDVILVDAADPRPPLFSPEDDVLAIDQGRIDIDQLVEDELILGCPMIPLHDDLQCRAAAPVSDVTGGDRKKTVRRTRRFDHERKKERNAQAVTGPQAMNFSNLEINHGCTKK